MLIATGATVAVDNSNDPTIKLRPIDSSQTTKPSSQTLKTAIAPDATSSSLAPTGSVTNTPGGSNSTSGSSSASSGSSTVTPPAPTLVSSATCYTPVISIAPHTLTSYASYTISAYSDGSTQATALNVSPIIKLPLMAAGTPGYTDVAVDGTTYLCPPIN